MDLIAHDWLKALPPDVTLRIGVQNGYAVADLGKGKGGVTIRLNEPLDDLTLACVLSELEAAADPEADEHRFREMIAAAKQAGL